MTTRTPAAELLRRRVVDVDGHDLGPVRDLRLARSDQGLVATGLVVGRRVLSERFGTTAGVVRGPALLTWWLRRRHSHLRWVPWERIATIDEDRVTLSVPAEALSPVLEVRR